MFNNGLANQDYERAILKAFWRKILTWVKGETNQLLPYDDVRDRIKVRGQHYTGMKQVPIEKIVGSMGRYNDFDRAFLPTQRRTKSRWLNIDKAHHEQVVLPPVDLFKIGEVYFVKDGNHRVSVAREKGQVYIDAFVTEIDISILLTPDMDVDDVALQQEQADFFTLTRLEALRPEVEICTNIPGQYKRLLEHIDVHRWYLGEQRGEEVPYEEAVMSWCDNVYVPLITIIHDEGLHDAFKGTRETDLYLWLVEYAGLLFQAYRAGEVDEEIPKSDAAEQLVQNYPQKAVKQLIRVANRNEWINQLVLEQEQAAFLAHTSLNEIHPQSNIVTTLPGRYYRLLEHIAAHRWYLGEQRQEEIPYSDAVASWYDNVYLPIVEIIREQAVLKDFPGRTETDLYLWIIKHQWHLREAYGEDVSFEEAVEKFTEDFSGKTEKVKDLEKPKVKKK